MYVSPPPPPQSQRPSSIKLTQVWLLNACWGPIRLKQLSVGIVVTYRDVLVVHVSILAYTQGSKGDSRNIYWEFLQLTVFVGVYQIILPRSLLCCNTSSIQSGRMLPDIVRQPIQSIKPTACFRWWDEHLVLLASRSACSGGVPYSGLVRAHVRACA